MTDFSLKSQSSVKLYSSLIPARLASTTRVTALYRRARLRRTAPRPDTPDDRASSRLPDCRPAIAACPSLPCERKSPFDALHWVMVPNNGTEQWQRLSGYL